MGPAKAGTVFLPEAEQAPAGCSCPEGVWGLMDCGVNAAAAPARPTNATEISTVGRPRNVGWVRAAALLYGDWGTSKAYVIGLGLFLMGYAALPHLLAVCAVTALVGVNYIWVCRCFATGGGVYTAAGLHARRLAVVGGLLLLADYIVTASLSCLDAFYYLGFEGGEAKKWAIAALFAIGAANYLGPKHTGSLAIWLAVPAVLVVVTLIIAGLPRLGEFHAQPPPPNLLHNWIAFTGMILALSGVEAAASNTGVMRLDPDATPERPSVRITSGRAVLSVMMEVVLGTALLSVLAMCLPVPGEELQQHKEDLLRFMGQVYVAPRFGWVVAAVFGLLLLSAVNTALGGMVSLLYVMARDRELPEQFTHLNRFGVPWVPLIAATVVPVIVLDLAESVENLASLYAIGVVGAIVLDIGSCAFAKSLPLSRAQRWVMKSTVALLGLIWITIALTKLYALLFVCIVLAVGLAVREYTRRFQPVPVAVPAAPEPAAAATVEPGAERPPFLGEKLLVAARGWTPALQFALDQARARNSMLLVLFVREVAVHTPMQGNWQNDPDARRLFTRLEREAADLKVHKLYSISDAPAETITDLAATFGVDTVILGGSKRAKLVNLLKGNVVTQVASSLPDTIRLVVVG